MASQLHDTDGVTEGAGRKSRTRFALISDMSHMDEIVTMAREAHAESRFSYIDFAPIKVRAIVERAISNPRQHAIMMAWEDGKPVGSAYCSVGEYHIGVGTLVTTIHNINVLKDVRHSLRGGRIALGLFRGMETWSQARSSREILFHVTSDVDLGRTHKLIKRLGYRFIGGSYAKTII